ncbi:hypothetical protein P171DRAFT_273437 [Karstenula rhodostoma CBS 690.94]|uniref:Uncharacterized protein n=1 Tax=Karstenula rhodostoma CBS 690.94 TaxID=1392251 RepID=A0A9P4PKE1_9PLEO|nr:hypothetical protein P171DRAFT_273437 [Karstenula rhodostoma CBS 690.94]
MSSTDRDSSRDRELVRARQSFSIDSRLHIPMWDSSDPERAPPPLPLNPGSPVLTIRQGTSSAIAQAAKALEEKARESMSMSSYTTNPMPQRSPERSLIKGAHHKRMQSFQNTGVKDLRNYLDSHKSPDRSPERPATKSGTPPRETGKDYFGGDLSPSYLGTPTPSSRDIPSLRPSARPPHKAILGENMHPSATMMALQTMNVPPHILDPPPPLNIDKTASKTPQSAQQNTDAISNQLHSIATIVSNLQKDMTQLSRRSKDNATDLVSLKEATNSRDEDIRKSLKDLVATMNHARDLSSPAAEFSHSQRDPHMTPTKQFTFPNIASPSSFFLDDRTGSPNPYSVEGAASVAMLEKIIREMVTKDGQERLINNLQKIVDNANGETAKKVTELVEFVKQSSGNNPFVRTTSAPFQPSPGPLTRTTSEGLSLHQVAEGGKPYVGPKAADFVSEEMLKFLRKIKDSVAESGCVTMGTKTLIQELRGEVLGMGRELARKIEEAEQAKAEQPMIEAGQANEREQVSFIVQEGLADLKEHMDKVMRERRRQSMSSTVTRTTVDNNEVYDVVKHALAECSPQAASLDQESILSAIREAFEAYKPNIDVETIGLERDEVLECLREGLQDYRGSGATKEEIEQIVQESLQHTNLPPPINEAHEIREEVIMAVRECLEELKPTFAHDPSPSDGFSREALYEVVKEALSSHNPGSQELEIPQESLYGAVKAALESSGTMSLGTDDAGMQRLQSLVDDMHSEFQAYSSGSGRDTEQVLDALRDGLDHLRTQLESYIDNATQTNQKDETVEHIRSQLEGLRGDFQGFIEQAPRGEEPSAQAETASFIKSEFEHLLEQLTERCSTTEVHKNEILEALNVGFEDMKSQVAVRGLDLDTDDEINEAMKQEFEQLKDVVLGESSIYKDEILEKVQAGFAGVQARLDEGTTATSSSDDVLATMKEEFEHLRETLRASLVKSGGTADKDDIIDAIRELIDGLRSSQEDASKESIAAIQGDLENLQETLRTSLVQSGGTADKDDIIDAIREQIDGLCSSQQDASKESIAAIQGDLENLKESLGSALVRAEDPADKEELLEALKVGLEEIKASSKATGFNEELLEAFRCELEQVRESNGVTRQHARADAEEVLEAVRLGLDDLRSHLEKKLDNPDRQLSATNDVLDALNEGLEGLRTDILKAVDKPVDMTVTYEILDTLKSGLAGLREDIDKMKGNNTADGIDEESTPTGDEIVLAEDPEQALAESTSREIVSESLRRDDLERMEVMLSQLQVKVEAMDANLQTPPAAGEPTPAPGTAMKDDLVSVEELLREVQAAVLVLQERENPAPVVEGVAMKDDLTSVEELLKEVQAAVLVLQEREHPAPVVEGVAMKDDTDAIETLLGNMKAKIEELPLPDPASMVTKENLDEVELVVRTTSEAIEALAKKFEEEGASKADVTVVQVIADDIKVVLDEMKAGKADDEEDPKATKTDVDAVTLLVDEVKLKLDDLKIPNPEDLPTKADVEQLTGLFQDFRDSYDKMKDQYEHDIEITAKTADDRKQEAAGLLENLTDVKVVLDDMKEEMKKSLEEGGPLDGLKESFKSLEDNVTGNFNVTTDVKELMETVAREFERAHGSIEALQNDQAEKSTLNLEKHDEAKEAIIATMVEKIDSRFDILMAKYDDAQLLADEQAKVMKEKAEEQEKILESTKTMAEELRLTIDTLGASITGMNDRFEEATTQWSTDSTAMTGKLDEYMAKFEDQKLDDKTEHSHTRDELKNIENIFNGLQDNVTEYHPKFMVALHEIEALVKAHYEHAQKAKEEYEEHTRTLNEEARMRSEELQQHFASLPALLPPPPPAIELPEKYDDAPVQEKLDKLLALPEPPKYDDAPVQEKLDKLLALPEPPKYDDAPVQEKLDKLLALPEPPKYDDAPVQEKLDQLLALPEPSKYDDAPVQEKLDQILALPEPPKYDDAPVQEKLDKLLEQVDEASKSTTHLERLDDIHAQVKATAAEVSELVAKQTQLITDGNEAKEREAEELALVVERRSAQKEQLEADVEGLKVEKERMVQELKEEKERAMTELREEKERTILELKEEKDSLLAVVATLQAERENLANQRVRLTGEVSSLHTALEIRREELHMMDAKADALERRILNGIMDHSRALMIAKNGQKSPTKHKKRISTDSTADASKLMPPPSTAANGLSFALKPRPAIRRNGPPQNPATRRIHSLSQISGNAPTGAQAYPLSVPTISNAGGLKRAHSVKTSSLRKGSWGGRPSAVVANKENEILSEEDEDAAAQPDQAHSIIEEDHDETQSQTGTERRHSFETGSYAESYAEGETPGYDGRSSFEGAGSEYTYASGSYMSGSDIDRRTSYGSHTPSGTHQDDEMIDERSDDGSHAPSGTHQDDETIEERSDDGSHYENSDAEDDEPTTTIANTEIDAPSEITASEVSTATAGDDMPMPTESEVDRAVEAVKEEMAKEAMYAPPSDSGVGTDLPTAALANGVVLHNEGGEDADYFRRAAEEESVVG